MHGAPGARNSGALSVSAGLLVFALAAGVLLLLVAAFRFALGAPASAGFWTIFFTPVLVAARLAGQSPPVAAFWLAAGVLLTGGLLCVLCSALNRRLPDALLYAVLGFELFFVARVGNSFLAPAGAPTWAALSIAQKLNLAAGVLALLAVWLAWTLRAKPQTPYASSAPSRITKFLKKRRLPSRILGAIFMALAVTGVLLVSHFAFWQTSTPVAPLHAIFAFLICNAIYLIGKKFWLRLT